MPKTAGSTVLVEARIPGSLSLFAKRIRGRVRGVSLLLFLASALVFRIAQAQSFLPAFEWRAPVQAASAAPCAVPPDAVRKLSVTSKYRHENLEHDEIDEEGSAQALTQLAPLRQFVSVVVKRANAYQRSGKADDAQCALSWLAAWARQGALSEMQDANAEFERASALAGLSSAALQIAPAVRAQQDFRLISAWMAGLAHSTIAYYDSTPHLKGSQNNHLYWAGLAAAQAAVLDNDATMMAWAGRVLDRAMETEAPDGSLPLEIARGAKARDYHLFAANALVPLAATLHRNGVAGLETPGTARRESLRRFIAFTLAAVRDPAQVAALAGKPQDPLNAERASNQFAFLAVYRKYFDTDARATEPVSEPARLFSTALGGDQRLLYPGR